MLFRSPFVFSPSPFPVPLHSQNPNPNSLISNLIILPWRHRKNKLHHLLAYHPLTTKAKDSSSFRDVVLVLQLQKVWLTSFSPFRLQVLRVISGSDEGTTGYGQATRQGRRSVIVDDEGDDVLGLLGFLIWKL